MSKEKDNIIELPKEADLSSLTLGYITKAAESVAKMEGLPAYHISLKGSKQPGLNGLVLKNFLLVIPGEEKHKVISFANRKSERLKDMTDNELMDFIKFHNK